MYIVAVDDGHGLETAGKRTPAFPGTGLVIRENEFNFATKLKLFQVLVRCGIGYVDVAPGQVDVPLADRVRVANSAKADIYVSIHYNAYDGKWDSTKGGIETYHYTNSVKGKPLAQAIHKHLIKGTKMPDRGIKEDSFYVLKNTVMPAVLCECGFMDVLEQAKLMLDEAYQWECAEEIGQGICEYFGVEYVAPGDDYRQKYYALLADIKALMNKYEVQANG